MRRAREEFDVKAAAAHLGAIDLAAPRMSLRDQVPRSDAALAKWREADYVKRHGFHSPAYPHTSALDAPLPKKPIYPSLGVRRLACKPFESGKNTLDYFIPSQQSEERAA